LVLSEDSFIIGTSAGLFILHNNVVSRLHIGATYGLTRSNNNWYAFQAIGRYGRLISFRLDKNNTGYTCEDVNYIRIGLSGGIHQIDYYDGILYVTDTYNNRIILMDGKKSKYFYPNGRLRSGRLSENYNHFNSIFFSGDTLFMIAHNETSKTKRTSEIFVFDKSNNNSFKLNRIIPTKSKDAHNIILFKNKLMYCNTMDGSLINGEDLFSQNTDYLTR